MQKALIGINTSPILLLTAILIALPIISTAQVYLNGDFRSKTTGTWTSISGEGSASWQQYNSSTSSWADYSGSPTGSGINVYINKNIEIPSASGSHTGVNIIVADGGYFTFSSSSAWTFSSLIIKAGCSMEMKAVFIMQSAGSFELEDNAQFIFNYAAAAAAGLSASLWNGVENFHPASSFIVKAHETGTGKYFLPTTTSVTPNTYNGVQAYFGNLVLQTDARLSQANFNNTILTHQNLEISPVSNQSLFYGAINTTIQGNLVISQNPLAASSSFVINGTTAGVPISVTIKGNLTNSSQHVLRITDQAAATATVNIDGNIVLTNNAQLDLNYSGSSSLFLKGDISVASTAILSATSAATLYFNGLGDGTTAATTQTINISSTASTKNRNILFTVKNGAYVQLASQDFSLGTNSKVWVENGGLLDFGFNGLTALNISGNGTVGTGFTSEAGAYLKISSPQGIVNTSGSTGNIRTNTAPVINALGTFHYTGKENQVTGNGLGTSSNGRAVIVDLADNALVLTPSVAFGLTNAANANINSGQGGTLDIRKGSFTETITEYVSGGSSVSNSAMLKMAADTYYKIVKPSGSGNAEYIPRFFSLAISGGSIELGANGSQVLRGSQTYTHLVFSGTGTKTVSTGTSDINGVITIKNGSTVDAGSSVLGNAATALTMEASSTLKTGGSGTKPDAGGTYLLNSSSTIEFQGTSTTTVRQGSPAINYANVVVSGSKVTSTSATAGISFQAGGSFTVKANGVFRVMNTAGFTGGSATAIFNTNSPTVTLETGSTIEYSRNGNQAITPRTDYQHVIISGGSNKTITGGNVNINGTLTLTDGILVPGSNTLLLTATASTSGGSSSAYINGAVSKLFTSSSSLLTNLPVGNSLVTNPVAYNPCGLVPTLVSSPVTYTVSFVNNPHPTNAIMGGTLQGIIKYGYWDISRVTSTPTDKARVALYYTNPTPASGSANNSWIYYYNSGAAYSNITDPCIYCNVAIVHRNSFGWQFVNSNFATADPEYRYNTNSGIIYSNPTSDFSPFSIGYAYNSILPIQLLYFTAQRNGKYANLNWQVAQADAAHFQVQHSGDGRNFTTIANLAGNEANNYSYRHLPDNAANHYYRLLITNKDGQVTYSNIVLLNTMVEDTRVISFSSLVTTELILQLQTAGATKASWSITDISGLTISTSATNIIAGANTIRVNTALLSSGLYRLNIQTTSGFKKSLSFLKQ